MNKKLVLSALGVGLSAALILPIPASAHNAGHVILPSGDCVNVGGNSVQLPETAHAPTTPKGELDLIPGPGDQFGARFAAEQGQSRVLPRPCP